MNIGRGIKGYNQTDILAAFLYAQFEQHEKIQAKRKKIELAV